MANMKKTKSLEGKARRVDFTFTSSDVRTVMLAGTFNNWDYKSTPLQKGKNDTWKKTVTLRPGRHEYKFVVDGKWILDPNNANRVWSSLGAENSVIEIK